MRDRVKRLLFEADFQCDCEMGALEVVREVRDDRPTKDGGHMFSRTVFYRCEVCGYVGRVYKRHSFHVEEPQISA